MIELDEQERKVVNEFCHLLEKSKQLFNGLRDLPQYGHKQWQAYFGRTFDVYTKLWKFQQQHRPVLDGKYGLKRWQIGEIASKIGQLYYHYYLRTSETNYLNEAFSFYAAIRGRAYYSRTNKDDRADLMVKKLRYYARFIVVCLLLKRMKLVRDLVRELSKQIDEYSSTYEPEDHLEWSLVLAEIKAFIEADNLVCVRDMDSNNVVLSHRLNSQMLPSVEKSMFNLTSTCLSLQEIFIVGNCNDQVKFSELTVDMFRMLQTLEREPQEDSGVLFDSSPATGKMLFENGSSVFQGTKRENPHKYLLYKPTLSQLMVFLASGFKELPANGAMMIYISADGLFSSDTQLQDAGYGIGGVVTNSKRENCGDISNSKRQSGPVGGSTPKNAHCLHPGDLYPFTRKPLFLVVDSDNSSAFASMSCHFFGQPLVVLMSPREVPPQFQNHQHQGNMFTLFLHSPLMGLCLVSSINDVPISMWNKCQLSVDKFVSEASKQLAKSRNLDSSYTLFYQDDFLRLLIVRFLFCSMVLRGHRAFKAKQFYPSCHPELPEAELLDHPALYEVIIDLVTDLNVSHLFYESLNQ